MLKGIVDNWLSRTDLQNQSTPEGQNYASLRSGILNNFLNQNQYNTGDALSSNYPWMPQMSGAASTMQSMMNPQASQSPIGQMLQQTSGQTPNLRQQMFLANTAMSDYDKSQIPAVDMSIRGKPDLNASAMRDAKAFYDMVDQHNRGNDYGSATYNTGIPELVARVQGTMNNMNNLVSRGGRWNTNGMIPMAQAFISRYGA